MKLIFYLIVDILRCFYFFSYLFIYYNLVSRCNLLIGYNNWSQEKSSSNNRGYAFVEYYNNACAEYSRQKMIDPKFKLGDNAPSVSWADPKNADSSTSSQVL